MAAAAAVLGDGTARRPGTRKFIGLLRLRDWLRVLGFELNGGKFGCYAPPFGEKLWLERFAFMEKAGARWWPIAGGDLRGARGEARARHAPDHARLAAGARAAPGARAGSADQWACQKRH